MSAQGPSEQIDVDDPGSTALSVREFAHELNSIVDGTARCARLALAALEGGDPQDAARSLGRVCSGLDDLRSIIGRTLGSRRSGTELLASPRTLIEEVEHVVGLIAPLAGERGVRVAFEVEPAARTCPAGTIGVILMNTVRNAVEAAAAVGGRPGCVDVTIGRVGDAVSMLVADTGPGFTAGFETGTAGIGLATCRRLVAAAGGQLEVVNAPFHGGAVVCVRVPIEHGS